MKPEYTYDNSPIKAGDIVVALDSTAKQYIKGIPYIVRAVRGEIVDTVVDSEGSTHNGWAMSRFRKVKTFPGYMNVKGDKAIYIGEHYKSNSSILKIGKLYTSRQTGKYYFYWNKEMNNRNTEEWVILATVNNINNERLI